MKDYNEIGFVYARHSPTSVSYGARILLKRFPLTLVLSAEFLFSFNFCVNLNSFYSDQPENKFV